MKRHCQFCERTVNYPALVCEDCTSRRFFTREEPKPFVPEWRKRSLAKDFTGRAA